MRGPNTVLKVEFFDFPFFELGVGNCQRMLLRVVLLYRPRRCSALTMIIQSFLKSNAQPVEITGSSKSKKEIKRKQKLGKWTGFIYRLLYKKRAKAAAPVVRRVEMAVREAPESLESSSVGVFIVVGQVNVHSPS